MGEIIKVGIIGTGVIFEAYANGLSAEPGIEIVQVADLDLDRAAAKARQFGVPAWGTPEELLANQEISLVVNITPPTAHAAVTGAAIAAGKHVYVEKPMATTAEEAQQNIKAANERGVLIGSAPDTFLGQAGRTALGAIQAGSIGTPFAATSFVRSSKVETWHPDPRAFYARGGGPVMDLGPYHLAMLVQLLGQVRSVTSAAMTPESSLAVTSPERQVDEVAVTVPTHVTGLLEFTTGVVGTVLYSFGVWDTDLPQIEVYGTEGTLALPDPNHYDLPVRIKRRGQPEWEVLAPVGTSTNPQEFRLFRGPGVVDLIGAIHGDVHQTSSSLALHVLRVLEALERGGSQLAIPSTRAEHP